VAEQLLESIFGHNSPAAQARRLIKISNAAEVSRTF